MKETITGIKKYHCCPTKVFNTLKFNLPLHPKISARNLCSLVTPHGEGVEYTTSKGFRTFVKNLVGQ